jgi:hypothetical protein
MDEMNSGMVNQANFRPYDQGYKAQFLQKQYTPLEKLFLPAWSV